MQLPYASLLPQRKTKGLFVKISAIGEWVRKRNAADAAIKENRRKAGLEFVNSLNQ
jgi:hypothetical protein